MPQRHPSFRFLFSSALSGLLLFSCDDVGRGKREDLFLLQILANIENSRSVIVYVDGEGEGPLNDVLIDSDGDGVYDSVDLSADGSVDKKLNELGYDKIRHDVDYNRDNTPDGSLVDSNHDGSPEGMDTNNDQVSDVSINDLYRLAFRCQREDQCSIQ